MTKKIMKPKKVVYLGPTLPGVAKEGTIYIDGITPQLEEACEQMPTIREFIVPVDTYEEVAKRLKDSEDGMSQIYNDISKNWR